MGVALKDLRGKVKRPVRRVRLCLALDLLAEHDELTAKLDSIRAAGGAAKMGENSEARKIAQQISDLETQMRDAEVTVEFKGISNYQLAEIQARFPAKDKGQSWDINAGAAALIAACAVEPTTEAEAQELLNEVNQKAADKLVSAAWLATVGSDEVPLSVRASALLAANA